MNVYTVTLIDKRVNVILTYEVTADSPKAAQAAALLKANLDAGTPKWLGVFEAVYTEVQ